MVKIGGRSPSETEAEAAKKVLNMLPQDGTRLGWSKLEKQAEDTGMSLRTLRKHLDRCQQAGVMARSVDTEARPPRVYYQLLTPEIFSGVIDSLLIMEQDIARFRAQISKIKNPRHLRKVLDVFFESETCLLMAELLCIWRRGIDIHEDQQARSFYKIMIENYIAPRITELGLFCRTFSDATTDPLSDLHDHYLHRMNDTVGAMIAAAQFVSETEKG
jgi:DNA-binding transcriptional ArsR family regulator